MAERKRSARAIRMHGREADGGCGCAVVQDRAGAHTGIRYCPLHEAAPALLEALERIVGPYYRAEGPDQQITVQEDVQARAAIAQAREVPSH